MSDIGPAQAEPLSEVQAKEKALRDFDAAEREAKNARKAAHDQNEAANTSGLYSDRAEKEQKIQKAVSDSRFEGENAPTDANADKAQDKVEPARAAAEAVLGEEGAVATQLPEEPEYDPNQIGKGKY
jgi:hypothetical protein